MKKRFIKTPLVGV
jgi:hypothetical protein